MAKNTVIRTKNRCDADKKTNDREVTATTEDPCTSITASDNNQDNLVLKHKYSAVSGAGNIWTSSGSTIGCYVEFGFSIVSHRKAQSIYPELIEENTDVAKFIGTEMRAELSTLLKTLSKVHGLTHDQADEAIKLGFKKRLACFGMSMIDICITWINKNEQ